MSFMLDSAVEPHFLWDQWLKTYETGKFKIGVE